MIQFIKNEFIEKKTYFYAAAAIFFISIIIGGLLPSLLPEEMSMKMQSYITTMLNQITAPQPEAGAAALYDGGLEMKSALGGYWLLLFFWWGAGLCVFGCILSGALLVYRGVLLGLTMNLLLHCDFAYGLVTVILTLLPSHLVMIPVFLLATVVSCTFARKMFQQSFRFDSRFLSYTVTFFALGLLTVAGSWLQTVAAPFLLRFFVGLV